MNDKFFYLFLDCVIDLINKDRVKIVRCPKLTHFVINLVENDDVLKRIGIQIYYQNSGRLIGVVDPIRRFHIEVVQGVTAILSTSSNNAESYDKLLELFKSAVNYMKRRDNTYNNLVVSDSLERKNWKKSTIDIEKEVDESLNMKSIKENFQREREMALNALTLKYRSQGYKIE